MYERFTDRARKVMQLANQEAQRFNHEYIGTEHILLGLAKEGSGVAANVLKNLDIDLRKIRLEVEKIVQSGPGKVSIGKLPQTPRAKKVVEYAIEEARNLNHNYVGTEHLLLGLLREGEAVAAQVLMNLGLKLDDVREEVLTILAPNTPMLIEGTGTEHKALAAHNVQETLEKSGRILTHLAREGKLRPAVAWADDIERLVSILSCHTRKNPFLLGPRGYCRTAIVEGLAQLLVSSDVPEWLKSTIIVDMGNNWRDDRWLIGAVRAAYKVPNIILFLDDVPLSNTADRFLSLLTLGVARGELRFIGATTPEDYRNYLEKDGALERWIRPVAIRPPTRTEAIAILRSMRPVYEEHHMLRIQDEALEAAVDLSDRHLGGSLPDKALDVLDEAAAAVRLNTQTSSPELRYLSAQIEELSRDKENAVADQEFDRAAQLRDRADELQRKKERLLQEWRDKSPSPDRSVGNEAVAEIVRQRSCGVSGFSS